MKKIFYFIIFITFSPIFAATNFNSLCSIFYNENISIKESYVEEKIARISKNEQFINLLPSVKLDAGLSYSEKTFQKEYPEYARISAEISQYILWGCNLSVSGDFVYIDTSEEENKHNYEPTAKLSATFTQSMAPYFYSFGARNPDFYLEKLNYLSAQNNGEKIRFSTINQFLQTFIEYKNLELQLQLTKKYLLYYENLFTSEEEIYNNQKGSYLNLFEKKQKLDSINNECSNLKRQEEKLIGDFLELCNYKLSFYEMKNLLNNSIKEDWYVQFSEFFSNWNLDNSFENQKNINMYSAESLKSLYLYKRQKLAPQLLLSADCSYNPTDLYKFEISVGLDFSNVFTPENLNLKKEYSLKKQILSEKNTLDLKLQQELKQSYTNNLNELKHQLKQLQEDADYIQTLYTDYKNLYINGLCSELEFQSIELNHLEIENEISRSRDKISYYSLLLNVAISE